MPVCQYGFEDAANEDANEDRMGKLSDTMAS